MSVFSLKLLAVLFMAVDHIGLFFFPEVFSLRIIGRLSFPLFAWLLANGYIHSTDRKKYFLRIVAFAFISQIPYMLAFQYATPHLWSLNIFFTLALGFVGIAVFNSTKGYYRALLLFLLLLSAFLLRVEYGVAGVLSIILFYIFYKKPLLMTISQMLLFFGLFTLPQIARALSTVHTVNMLAVIQPVCLLSLIIISHYNGTLGRKWKYFFYLFYPIHLLIIYLLLST